MNNIFNTKYNKSGLYILVCITIFINSVANCQIKTVKQDSTGNYIKIQSAINDAIEGDTILVWPGTYYENVDLLGKSITLGSLSLTTNDESYKYNTIINGSKKETCLLIDGVEDGEVNGLTLTNGAGYHVYLNLSRDSSSYLRYKDSLQDSLTYGGGIYCRQSYFVIDNCVIKNNYSNKGGGAIQLNDANLLLIRSNIFHNSTLGSGGAINISGNSKVSFDSLKRNNIFSNHASLGCEIISNTDSPKLNITLDTFTVATLSNYFALTVDSRGYPIDSLISFNILHQKIIPYDGDLYVNPLSGNDTNTGNSPEFALKTIFYALSKIVEDSLDKNIIHLANGVYSDSTNGEKFPLNVRSNVIIRGESMNGVVWDGRNKYRFIRANNLTHGFEFKNITMKRGKHKFHKDAGAFLFYLETSEYLLDSITVTESVGYSVVANFINSNNAIIKNSVFTNNKGGNSAVVAGIDYENPENYYNFINCKFTDNLPDYDNPEFPGGGGLSIGGNPGTLQYNNPTVISNCLFANNDNNGLSIYGSAKPYIINCTFADNPYVGFDITWGADSKVYNSIFYNTGVFPLFASNYQTSDTAMMEIYYSLIENGEESIILGNNGAYYYDNTNIDTIPFFLNMWNDPYMISDGSPCIDAGTLANLPDFIELPEYDLAGNPRVVGDSIDMGAYEWNPTIVGFHDIGQSGNINKNTLLKVSPNPFREYTLIEFFGSQSAKQGQTKTGFKIEVYDNYGRLVRNILSTTLLQDQKIGWQGDDNNGNLLPAGIYNVVLFSGDEEIESLKVVKR